MSLLLSTYCPACGKTYDEIDYFEYQYCTSCGHNAKLPDEYDHEFDDDIYD